MKVNTQILPKTGDIHPLIAYLAIIGSCRKVGIIIEIPVTMWISIDNVCIKFVTAAGGPRKA